MPLTPRDRKFLQAIDRMKFYILIMAAAIFLYLLCIPQNEIHAGMSILGIALCGVFWITQRLLSFISVLDIELTRVVNVLKRSLPEAEKKELFS